MGWIFDKLVHWAQKCIRRDYSPLIQNGISNMALLYNNKSANVIECEKKLTIYGMQILEIELRL